MLYDSFGQRVQVRPGTYNHGRPAPALNVYGAYDESAAYDDGIPMDGFYATEDASKILGPPLTDEQRLICTPLVRGYALKEKKWLNLFINAVRDIAFSDNAFDSLVLPKDQKELILSFVTAQSEQRAHFDDMIQGKGRGIITLLYGPPGVGKTLTAESVAEEMKVPLMVMASGDLGQEPAQIEWQLTRLMSMCTRWNGIFLLDEADVFLEERQLHELERNKLVSIFLRVLEYYQGIIFLTTNRVHTFDPAFQSRIHIAISYKELDEKSRRQIWVNFLKQHNIAQAAARERPFTPPVSAAKYSTHDDVTGGASNDDEEGEKKQDLHIKRTQPHAMNDKDIDKLADMSMNGRTIKNVLKNAQLMASQKGEGWSLDHVKTAREFTQQLQMGHQENDRNRNSLFG